MAPLTAVDPRGCGGARPSASEPATIWGRSPRVRGSPNCYAEMLADTGSIPAGAGEPQQAALLLVNNGVDPRGCGGAVPTNSRYTLDEGRSPRVRGSRNSCLGDPRHRGSIPAGAGEPSEYEIVLPESEVDPRGCGGAVRIRNRSTRIRGRSPRVRGSPIPGHACSLGRGSIPAGAGEPPSVTMIANMRRVDPRGCGGAYVPLLASLNDAGRSPRVRGSPQDCTAHCWPLGSIPAGAGEPLPPCPARCPGWVDPRGCGGAPAAHLGAVALEGRSPRVRGSRSHRRRQRVHRGSIPAGAGEPTPKNRSRCHHRVDPRGCGGAIFRWPDGLPAQGRSPRVRGSPARHASTDRYRGSIPAGAGEPVEASTRCASSRVDPRGCGGAH